MQTTGTLSVVGTPIGNLEDITLRALRVLREADFIACEDTRTTRVLLAHHGISGPALMTFNAHSTDAGRARIIAALAAGKRVALVSDAGTPGVSDPGTLLVAEARTALGDAVRIETIPGPSALTAALAVAGLPVSDFLFLGFLPHKKGRATLLREIAASSRTVVLYESTHRITKLLGELVVAAPDRIVTLARELTKIYEEVRSGTPAELSAYLAANPEHVRGEFVVLVAPR